MSVKETSMCMTEYTFISVKQSVVQVSSIMSLHCLLDFGDSSDSPLFTRCLEGIVGKGPPAYRRIPSFP